MIYTVTFNPSIDYFIDVNKELLDTEVNRADEEKFIAAGKGINISKVLNNLDIDSVAIALLGGFTGNYIEEEINKYNHITLKKIDINGDNRINVKIHNNKRTLCVNGKGPSVNKDIVDNIKDILKIDENDVVIISGSLALGLGISDIYELCNYIHIKKSFLVVDMESIGLNDLKIIKPDLIKPNLYEFRKIVGNDIDIEEGLKLINEYDVKNILLSLGEDGSIFYNNGNYYYAKQENVKAINKVGCGDSMLATFIASKYKGLDFKESLKYATAAGLASVSQKELVSKNNILSFLNKVEVKNYKEGTI